MKTNYASAFSYSKPKEENKQKHKKDAMGEDCSKGNGLKTNPSINFITNDAKKNNKKINNIVATGQIFHDVK